LLPGFDDHDADLTAFDEIRPGAQDTQQIGRVDQNQVIGIEPQFDETGSIKMTALVSAFAFANPDDGFARRIGAHGDHYGKSGGNTGIFGRRGKNLMQRRPDQTPADTPVDRIDAEGQHRFACRTLGKSLEA
jgi:hypothetical protein